MKRLNLFDQMGVFIGDGKMRREVKLYSSPKSEIVSENFALGMTIIDPGQEHEVHEHDANEEIIVVYGGRGYYRIGDRTEPIQKGDVLGFTTNEPHGFVNTGDEKLMLLWIYYPPGVADDKFLIKRA